MTVSAEHGRAPWGCLGLVLHAGLGAVVLTVAGALLVGAWFREVASDGMD